MQQNDRRNRIYSVRMLSTLPSSLFRKNRLPSHWLNTQPVTDGCCTFLSSHRIMNKCLTPSKQCRYCLESLHTSLDDSALDHHENACSPQSSFKYRKRHRPGHVRRKHKPEIRSTVVFSLLDLCAISMF